MPMKRIVLLLSLTAQSLVPVFAGSKTATNPPSECKAEDASCSCEKQDDVADDCIKVNLDMGTTTPWTGSRRCSLKVFADGEKGYAEVNPDAERLSREGANEFIRRCVSKTLEELR